MVPKDRKAKFHSLVYRPRYNYKLLDGEKEYIRFNSSIIESFDSLMVKGISKGVSKKYREKENEIILDIQDYNIGDDVITILLNVTSNRFSDPVYRNKKSNRRNKVNKQDGDEMEFNAHVMIGRKIVEGKSQVLAEAVAGLSAARIKGIITEVFKNAKAKYPKLFQHDHPDGSCDKKGKPRQAKFAISCDIEGVASDQLIRDIERGEITGLDVVAYEHNNGSKNVWDSNGYITEDNHKISLKMNAPTGKRMLALREICNKIKGDDKIKASKINLRFKDNIANANESVSFNLNESDPFDCEYFNKTIPLEYESGYTSHDGLVDDIMKKMRPHFR